MDLLEFVVHFESHGRIQKMKRENREEIMPLSRSVTESNHEGMGVYVTW